jgi:predicted alpha/beta superfamily hydrolase
MTKKHPRVSLYQTEERKLFSTLVNREYRLAVCFPDDYASTQQAYPVMYLLDGSILFGMAASLTGLLNMFGTLPKMIVVGINYNFRSYGKLFQLRELDFKIPQVQDAPPDSHADRFLAAIKQEIIPFVESNYRADPAERIIYGYSSSGFFVLYALFHEPGLFRRYLAGSGDTDLSYPYMLAHDQRLVSREKKDPIDLYLSVGSLEERITQSTLSSFLGLVDGIKTRNYPGLRLITEVNEGEKHGAWGVASTYINGLRKCFQH